MANHCWNTMTITNFSEVDKERILDFFKSYENFDYLTHWGDSIAKPEDRTVGEITYDNCYKYGSRWWDFDIDTPISSTRTHDYIMIQGDSAWSPMTELAMLLTEVFKCHIKLEFHEAGMDFAGIEDFEDGIMTNCEEFTYGEYEYLYLESSYHVQKMIEDIRDGAYEGEALQDFVRMIKYMNSSDKEKVTEEFTKQIKINT